MLDLIKGRRVEDALNTLAFTQRSARRAQRLKSCCAKRCRTPPTSATKRVLMSKRRPPLSVKRAVANDAPRLKRIRPAPMGRAFRYQRRMSHLEIALAEKAIIPQGKQEHEEVAQEAAPAASAKKKASQ